MAMPARKFNNAAYRYGMNGQEKDEEVFDGAMTADYWEYDSRIGRRWETDPVVKPWESSYACFSDNPISNIDINGNDSKPTGDKTSNPNNTKGGPKNGETCDNPNGSFETYINGEWKETTLGGGVNIPDINITTNNLGKNKTSSASTPSTASLNASLGKVNPFDLWNGYVRFYGEAKSGVGVGSLRTARISGTGIETNNSKRTLFGVSVNTEDVANAWDKNHGVQDPVEIIIKSTLNAIKQINNNNTDDETGAYYGGAIIGVGASFKMIPNAKRMIEITIKVTYEEFGLVEYTMYEDGTFKNIFIGGDLSAAIGTIFFGEVGVKGGIKIGDK